MDGPALSRRERRILTDVEAGLRADRRLDDALRTMRPPRRLAERARRFLRVPVSMIVLLAAFALGLTTVVVPTPSAAGLVVLGAAWAAALLCLGARLAAGPPPGGGSTPGVGRQGRSPLR